MPQKARVQNRDSEYNARRMRNAILAPACLKIGAAIGILAQRAAPPLRATACPARTIGGVAQSVRAADP
jgi:hypothetical protein